jgi:hypothetical protein
VSVSSGDDTLISVILVVYDMAREAPRTLYSLSREYQREIGGIHYEVIVVDNGSPRPLGEDVVRAFGDEFRYVYIEDASPSPARAINGGVALARGSIVAVMIDGARMLSPGVIRYAASAFRAFSEPVVNTVSLDLGPDTQPEAISRGYDASVEDAALARVEWQRNGYGLFDIGVLSPSCRHGVFRPMAESNCLFLRKELFERIGGMSEAFQLPGGGFVNLDFFERANTAPGVTPVMLLGEATFHQVHGGASTSAASPELKARIDSWRAHYAQVRGRPYVVPGVEFEYVGHAPREFLRVLSESGRMALHAQASSSAGDPGARTGPARSRGASTGLRSLIGRLARAGLRRKQFPTRRAP